MPKFTIRVSQRVYYDVHVRAGSALDALKSVAAALSETGGVDIEDIGEGLFEVDNDCFEIEPLQTTATGDPMGEGDPAFADEMARVARKAAP